MLWAMLEADELTKSKLWAALWGSLPCNDQRAQLLEISDMLKLQSPRSTEFPSAAGDLEESGSESTDSLRTHGVSFQSCAAEPLREISLNDPDPIFLYQANPNLQHEPHPKRFTVLTWNACAISFPLHIHPTKFVLGLILGCWWHDRYCDVPMRLDQDLGMLSIFCLAHVMSC